MFDSLDDLLAVLAGSGTDCDIANDKVVADVDDIDGANVAAGAANRHRQLTKRAGT